MNIILTGAETAAGETATPQMRRSARDIIRKQVDRMNNLINEFLEFTRGPSSTTILATANYAEFVMQLIEEIRTELTGRSVVVELENEPPDVSVLVDPTRLSHVFQNLVYNACDAMPDGGRVKLRFQQSDRRIITEIEDSGTGIAPEIAPRLFEAFATYGKAQGTGLGLSICKTIVEDHHGAIGARSDPGRGAVLYFSLPLPGETGDKS